MKSGSLPKSFRLSPEAEKLLRSLAEDLGVGQTSVLEMAIRQMAETRGLRKKEEN